MARRRRGNPWVSAAEVLVWVLFAALIFPVGFAGWAIGHYTSLGKPSGTRTVTVTTAAAPASTSTPATTAAAPTTTAAAAGGANAAAGKAVFAANGCAACHTFKPAGANGTIGPNLDTTPAKDAAKVGMPLPAFLKQSIVDPNAYISPGFPKGVMPTTFKTSLSATQLANLVAFLQTK